MMNSKSSETMLLLSSVKGEVPPVHTDTRILGCLGSFTCKGLITDYRNSIAIRKGLNYLSGRALSNLTVSSLPMILQRQQVGPYICRTAFLLPFMVSVVCTHCFRITLLYLNFLFSSPWKRSSPFGLKIVSGASSERSALLALM